MRLSSILLLGVLALPLPAWAVDEAATLERIRALQAQPEAGQRAWLQQWVGYQSQERMPFDEGRMHRDLPRYPIAAAAEAALQRLDAQDLLQQLRSGRSSAAPDAQAPASTLWAWARFVEGSPELPEPIRVAGPSHYWAEELLRNIAAHPAAGPEWTAVLLATGEQASTLRWLDQQLPTLGTSELLPGAHNPALGERIWLDWARRANAGDAQAREQLLSAWTDEATPPAAAAGLAAWAEGADQARSLLLGPTKSSARALAQRVLLRLGEWPRQALYAEPQP